MIRSALVGVGLCCLLGCATVVERGPGALADPGEQRIIAQLIDAAVKHLPEDVSGQDVQVVVAPADPSYHRYANMRLEVAVIEAGGRPREAAPRTLSLELRVAGWERAERNLVLPLGQYARLPLYYGQDSLGDLGATLRYADASGLRTWDVSGVRRDRTSYLFRVAGPF